MVKLWKSMSYKEFKDWCNQRACDGQWSLSVSQTCIKIISDIEEYKITKFGFMLKKKTEELQEKIWREFIDSLIEINYKK